ncbi:MAG: SDR family oxidoreductase [Bdellovibrionota bacterium]
MRTTRPVGGVSFSNEGRVLLVTGGGQGIGNAIARAFADTGGTSAVMEVNETLRENVEPWGEFIAGNVADPDDCRRVVRHVVERFGGLDVLVPNAVIEGPESYRRPHEYDTDIWRRYVDVNFTGMQNIAQAAIPVMLQQQLGYIVIISSVQGVAGARQSSLYAATKAATRSFIDTWATSYARDGIRVNGILPGAILTEGMVPKLSGQGGMRDLANRHARGCLGLPEEVALLALALSSPVAANIFGSAVRCDGGLLSSPPFDTPFDPDTLPEQPTPRWQQEQVVAASAT